MDYLRNLYQHQNVTIAGNTLTYLFEIDPTNEMYAKEDVSNQSEAALIKTIAEINMQGSILLIPRKEDVNARIMYMDSIYDRYRDGTMDAVYDQFRMETYELLVKELIYTHRIIFAFVDGRKPFMSKSSLPFLKRHTFGIAEKPNKDYRRYLEQASHIIFERLGARFGVKKVEAEDAYHIYQSLLRPSYKDKVERTYTLNPSQIEQNVYQYTESEGKETYCTRHYLVKEMPVAPNNGRLIAGLTMLRHPVVIAIKFDLRAAREAMIAMEAYEQELEEEQKKYRGNTGRRNREYDDAKKLAKYGASVFSLPENTEVQTQIIFRIEAKNEEQLNERAKELKSHCEDSYQLKLDPLVGKQHDAMQQMLPFLNVLKLEHPILFLTIGSFVNLHPLAGIKIGNIEGVPVSYIYRKNAAAYLDWLASFENKTVNAQPATGVFGEAGSGKSELVKYMEMTKLIVYNAPLLKFDPKKEPDKIHEIEWLQPIMQRIILGSGSESSGIFDPMLRYKDEPMRALEEAKTDIRFIFRALNYQVNDGMLLDEAILAVLEAYRNKKITQPTLSEVTQVLINMKSISNEAYLLGRNLLSASTMGLANLFFADQDTKITIDFTKYKYTLIQFMGMPKIDKYNENNMMHVFASYTLSKCNMLAEQMLHQIKGLKQITIEEYGVFRKTPEGSAAAEDILRLCRALLGSPTVVSQQLSDAGESLEAISNNIGQFFIGSISSKREREFIINELGLDQSPEVIEMLSDKTKSENVSIDEKFVFLWRDFNNRTAFVRNKQLPMFERYFDTSGNREELRA
ncbi:ATP-binding protein [Culicoidibacter larvae]|nr:ATP-binding protein [Culicoidibacter larvae]